MQIHSQRSFPVWFRFWLDQGIKNKRGIENFDLEFARYGIPRASWTRKTNARGRTLDIMPIRVNKILF